MKAWQLLKHLEEGGTIKEKDDNFYRCSLQDLRGWDYEPLRNPDDWEIEE